MLAFGLPGTGKTHALCAVGHRLVESGRSKMIASDYRLVQDLLIAERYERRFLGITSNLVFS